MGAGGLRLGLAAALAISGCGIVLREILKTRLPGKIPPQAAAPFQQISDGHGGTARERDERAPPAKGGGKKVRFSAKVEVYEYDARGERRVERIGRERADGAAEKEKVVAGGCRSLPRRNRVVVRCKEMLRMEEERSLVAPPHLYA